MSKTKHYYATELEEAHEMIGELVDFARQFTEFSIRDMQQVKDEALALIAKAEGKQP